MAMMLQGSDGIMDEALPLADLAASLRLPDGYETIPGQITRMQGRLRAAIAMVEGRTGKALIARNFVLQGTVEAGKRVPLPVSPVAAVGAIELQQGSAAFDLSVEFIEVHPYRPIAVLSQAVRSGSRLTMSVTAGYSSWAQVPAPLREAVLMLAEQFDTGEEINEVIDGLIAPYRQLRIGGVV